MEGISIVICCYNSAKRLPKTLFHLSKQKLESGAEVEIIVVDNASTKNTFDVSKTEWGKYSSKAIFRNMKQPISGQTAALEMGVNAALYNYILPVDDDNWLDESFL